MELTLREGFVLGLAAIGTFFMIVSSIGVLRMPDAITRMHALGKAATVGISGLLLSLGIYFYEDGGIFLRMFVLVVLFFITAPIASTTMGRAAYRTRSEGELMLVSDEIDQINNPSQHFQPPAESRN